MRARGPKCPVSEQQRQVFQLLADGRRPKDVARELDLTAHTVAGQLRAARKQLATASTSAALAKLMRRGHVR